MLEIHAARTVLRPARALTVLVMELVSVRMLG
jgi:hypothetical protein